MLDSLNKKAQGLSRNAIILLVIGVIVLVILIIGFTQGWGKIAPFLSGNNVDSINQNCKLACNQQKSYSYCNQPRDLNAEDQSLKSVTCNYLAKKEPQYGTTSCNQISCDQVTIVDLGKGENLQDYCNADNNGQTLQAMANGELVSEECNLNS